MKKLRQSLHIVSIVLYLLCSIYISTPTVTDHGVSLEHPIGGLLYLVWAFLWTNFCFTFKRRVISREDNVPYLIRYSLFDFHYFAIKIHKILISDDACLHDHPWKFITFLIKGSYIEERPQYLKYQRNRKTRTRGHVAGWKNFTPEYFEAKKYKRFSLLYRESHYVHRLIINEPVTTIVITFRKTKTWGFFTPKGFVEWFNYKYDGQC